MPQDLSAKKANFSSKFVQEVEGLLDFTDKLITRRIEYDTTGYGPGSGSEYEIIQEDLSPNGSNLAGSPKSNLSHLTPNAIADAFTSLQALKDLLVQGHLTNLNRIRR